MKKLNYTLTGEEMVDIDSIVQSLEVMAKTLTLKETDELVEKILTDIRRKLNEDTYSIINEVRDLLEKTYSPEKN